MTTTQDTPSRAQKRPVAPRSASRKGQGNGQAHDAYEPPHSLEAEQSVLGGLLLDNSAWPVAAELLSEGDFHLDEHGHIFTAIGRVISAGLPADVITLFQQLKADGHGEDCGGPVYLNSLARSVPSAANVGTYAGIVRERSLLRRIASDAEAIARAARADDAKPASLRARIQEVLAQVDDSSSQASWPSWVRQLRDWTPPADLVTCRVDINFAVDDWILRSKVGALVAAGGTGKTTLLLMLGICHALERPFFGCKVIPGSFLLLSADDSQEDLEAALALVVRAMKLTVEQAATVAAKVRVISIQGSDDAAATTFTTMVDGTLMATDLVDCVLHAVAGIDDLVGIALDTLRQFSGGSSNDEQVIKLTIAGAARIASKTGAYVLLSHHTGKQNYRDGVTDMYCGSGSAAIADNCRHIFLLQATTWPDIESKVQRTAQERGDPLVLSSNRGNLLMKSPPPMFLHRDGYFIGRVAGAVLSKEQRADERDRDVLRAVARGCQTKSTILARIGGKRSDQFARVDDLVARGLLVDNGSQTGSRSRPNFVLTDKGSKWLRDAN